jgi:hypothetical protein
MAMTNQQRSAKAAQKRAALGEEELRLRARIGTHQALTELMRWAGITEQGEALTLMIHHVQGLGSSGVLRFLGSRHKIEDSQNVACITDNALIRFGVRPGTLTALNDHVEWIGAQDQSSAMRLIIHTLHEAGPNRALRFLAMPPRKPYEIPAHIAAKLQLAYNREAMRICHDE